jgi:hypothetical protein
MINVISYSLWGDKMMYWIGAQKNIESRDKYFPDYHVWFYVGETTINPEEYLIGKNIKIIRVEDKIAWGGMFWRFHAVNDPEVNIFLSRDTDSRFSDREVAAINEWLKSDKDFHIMRDHPYHNVKILGGMWGCRNGILRSLNIPRLIESWNLIGHNSLLKGCDQDFLGQVIYNSIKSRAFEHSEFGLNFGNPIHPFPTERQNYEFVGDVFDENDIRHPDYWKLIKNIIG